MVIYVEWLEWHGTVHCTNLHADDCNAVPPGTTGTQRRHCTQLNGRAEVPQNGPLLGDRTIQLVVCLLHEAPLFHRPLECPREWTNALSRLKLFALPNSMTYICILLLFTRPLND